MGNKASLMGLFETPVTAFYSQLREYLRCDVDAACEAREALTRDFGPRGVSELHADELKWFNGQVLRILQRRGALPPVRR